MIGVEVPCCSHVAMPTRGEAQALAAFVEGNPLSGDWMVDIDAPSKRLVSWSGTMASELFGDDPRTWMRAGQERFAAFLDEITPALRHHQRTLCFRPHHRHVLGDVHASVKLLRERADRPFEVLLSPADMIAPSMMSCLDDHLERMFTHLGEAACAVLLCDIVATAETAENGLFSPCPLGEGLLPAPLLARLLRDHVPATTPIIFFPGNIEAQRVSVGM